MIFTGVKGDADAAFRDADYVRRERFSVQRHTALPMEPRGVLAEWDAAQRPDDGAGRGKGAVLQPRYPGGNAGPVAGPGRPDRERCWRRLWRPRRVLSRGFPDPVRRAACRPPGPLARGPARASDGDEPCARGGLRDRDRLPQRRHDPRRARRGLRRPRGLCPHQWVDPAAHLGAMPHRPVSRAECADHLDGAAHQQDPVRHLSRARPLRGLVLLRAADRAGGARPGDRQRRDASAQPDRRRRDAVPAAPAGAGRSGRSIPSATAATIAKPSNAVLPSSAGTKNWRCKAARSTGATTASPSPALSRAAEPVQRRRRGSSSRRMARSRSMSARLPSGRASKR